MNNEIEQFGLVKHVINNGGMIKPLLIPAELTGGTGLMNPSVFVNDGTILVNIRHVNYTLYHSEHKKFQHQWGPLQYLHPENDMTLTTVNYMCSLNEELDMVDFSRVDTSMLDVPPTWHFIGLEDARLFRWNNSLYHCGVRRDTTGDGQGRMELSELALMDTMREVSRERVPTPDNVESYCEKNWMPIVDMPYHFVKWSNPTQVVKYDTETKLTSTVYLDESKRIDGMADLRGGSQVIRYKNYRIALTHATFLFNSELGRKDGRYRHQFIVWDEDWNVVKITKLFSFMEGDIEFCCGASFYKDSLLVSFGFQDNAAYILKIPTTLLETYLEL